MPTMEVKVKREMEVEKEVATYVREMKLGRNNSSLRKSNAKNLDRLDQ
jgi:hypothetical protein